MWFLLSLVAAASDAGKNVLAKMDTSTFPALIINWGRAIYSLIFILPLMIWVGWPSLDQTFWTILSLRTILDFIAAMFYLESIKWSDLSLSLPLLSLTPLFLLFTDLVINHSLPSLLALSGVLLIVIGTYWLNFRHLGQGLLEPFHSLYRDPGLRLMLGVSMIWALTSSMHTIGIAHSSPIFYAGASVISLALLFSIASLVYFPRELASSLRWSNLRSLVPIGLLDGLTTISQMAAQSMTAAVLVISVKRLSVVFPAGLGAIYFQERIGRRFVPIVLMLVGVILIALF